MRLGLSWADAAAVVVSGIGVYLGFVVLIRMVGQRVLAAMSSFDFAAALALGAVMGRAVLGYTPTLLAGLLGMATLLTLQALSGRLRRNPRFDRALSNLPLLLVANGAALTENLRKAKIVDDELRQKLRLAGVHSYDDVVAVILERTGAVSVMRQGETIASDLLSDVRGREALAREHIRPLRRASKSNRRLQLSVALLAIEQPGNRSMVHRGSAARSCGSTRAGSRPYSYTTAVSPQMSSR